MSILLSFFILSAQIANASPTPAKMPEPGPYVNSATADGGPIIQIIKAATKTLDIEIYTMTDVLLRKELRNALARGVRIRIVKDPKPTASEACPAFSTSPVRKPTPTSIADCADYRAFVTDLNDPAKNPGSAFIAFNKNILCSNHGGKGGTDCFEHGKIIIADYGINNETTHETALISTGNFDDSNLCIASEKPTLCNRDYSVVVNNDGFENGKRIIDALEQVFTGDLNTSRDGKLDPNYSVEAIAKDMAGILTISPYSFQPLSDLIGSANQSVYLENQYLHDAPLNKVLTDKGKDLFDRLKTPSVNVTIASICNYGKPTASEVKRTTQQYLVDFKNAGISSWEFTPADKINSAHGYMHAKVVVVDPNNSETGKMWIGSVNGSNASLNINREYGVFISKAQHPQWFDHIYAQVLSDHTSRNSESVEDSIACVKENELRAAEAAAAAENGLPPPPAQENPEAGTEN